MRKIKQDAGFKWFVVYFSRELQQAVVAGQQINILQQYIDIANINIGFRSAVISISTDLEYDS